MKKIALTVVSLLALGMGTGFAAPVNNLNQGQTAIGIQDNDFYVEHKMSDNLTLGLGEDDIYGQIGMDNNLRAIIGSKDYGNDSQFYIGAAYNTPIAPSLDGYVSLIGAKDFRELQVGANYNLTNNFDVNVNYSSLMPDEGRNHNRTTLGAAYKF